MTPRKAIAFRTVAGKTIGFGHLRRCLTLAEEFRALRSELAIELWIDGDAEAVALAGASGFDARAVHGEEPDATFELARLLKPHLLVVDSYAVREGDLGAWRTRMPVAVIDDLADRFLDADVVINVSPHAKSLRYRTSAGCKLLLGPEYALLRPRFRALAPRETRASMERLLLTLGGADPLGSTAPALQAVLGALPGVHVDVIVGPLFGATPELDEIEAREQRVRVHRDVTDLSEFMQKANLAVSAGGQTLLELAAMGLPAVVLSLAANQEGNIAALDGVTVFAAGRAPDVSAVGPACRALAADSSLREAMSRAGQRLVDGQGARRAAEALLEVARGP